MKPPKRYAKKIVAHAYRQAAKTHHPDHCGDGDVMIRVIKAKKLLDDALKHMKADGH